MSMLTGSSCLYSARARTSCQSLTRTITHASFLRIGAGCTRHLADYARAESARTGSGKEEEEQCWCLDFLPHPRTSQEDLFANVLGSWLLSHRSQREAGFGNVGIRCRLAITALRAPWPVSAWKARSLRRNQHRQLNHDAMPQMKLK